MNKLLAAMFVALLMVGCVEIGSLLAPEVQMIPPLSEEQEKIIAEAIRAVEYRVEKGEELAYAPNQQTPYTGWRKKQYGNGQIKALTQFKDGKAHGLELTWYVPNDKENRKYVCIMRSVTIWKNGKPDGLWIELYENGQKMAERNHKDGKLMSAVSWKPNGEKCLHTNVKGGNGVCVEYRPDGTEKSRSNFRGGEEVSLWWHANGQKAAEGNFKDGKKYGLWIYYNENGTEKSRQTYKDGERVDD